MKGYMSINEKNQSRVSEKEGIVTGSTEAGQSDHSDEVEAMLREGTPELWNKKAPEESPNQPQESQDISQEEESSKELPNQVQETQSTSREEEKNSTEESISIDSSFSQGRETAVEDTEERNQTSEPLPQPEEVKIPDSPAPIFDKESPAQASESLKEAGSFPDDGLKTMSENGFEEKLERAQEPAPETIVEKLIRLKDEREKLKEEADRGREVLAAELHKTMAKQKEEVFMLSEKYESDKAAIESNYSEEIQKINAELAELEKVLKEIQEVA